MYKISTFCRKIFGSYFQTVFVTFIIYRLCFFLLHLVTLSLGPVNNNSNFDLWHAFPDNTFFDSFFRADSGWYTSIIHNGYNYHPGKQSNVAFFPLYPFLIKLVTSLTDLNIYVVGFLISNICLLFGLYFVYKISLIYFKRKTSQRTLILMLVFPTSFFYSSLYTESLYLLVISATFYYYLKNKYLLSGIWGFLASLTRVTGILLFVTLAIELLINIRKDKLNFKLEMLYLFLIPMGLITYMLFLFLKFNDPLVFVHAQQFWNRGNFTLPWITLANNLTTIDFSFPRNPTNSIKFIDFLFTTSFLCLSIYILLKNRINFSLPLFCIFSILIPLTTGVVDSMARYILPLFPVFIYLGLLSRNNYLYKLLIFGFSYLLSVFFLWFAGWNFGIW